MRIIKSKKSVKNVEKYQNEYKIKILVLKQQKTEKGNKNE